MGRLEKTLVTCWALTLGISFSIIICLGIFCPPDNAPNLPVVTTESEESTYIAVEVPSLGDSHEDAAVKSNMGQGSNAVSDSMEYDALNGESQFTNHSTLNLNAGSSASQVPSTPNCYHGDTIAEVIESLRYEEYEVIVAFTADGQKLFEQTDWDRSQAFLTKEQHQLLEDMEGEIFIHNHPNFDAPFSSTDLYLLGKLEVGQGLVVSSQNVYSLLPKDAWGDPDQMYDVSLASSKLAPGYGQTVIQPDGRVSLYTTDALLFYVAEYFDLKYSKTPFQN